MKHSRFFLIIICLAVLVSCEKDIDSTFNTNTTIPASSETGIVPDFATFWSNSANYTDDAVETVSASDEDILENSTFDKEVTINYNGTTAIVSELPTGVTAHISDAGIIITSTIEAVKYILSGSTSNGFFRIYSDYKFCITLNSVQITNSTGPAINSQSSKRCFINVIDGTTNQLTDGTTYTTSTEDMKSCLFSEGQIIFSGNGTLKVKGNYNHAICSDDYLRIRNGNITVNSVSDGLHANESITIGGGSLSIEAGSDGIDCENGAITIKAGKTTVSTTAQKGHGVTATGNVAVSGGVLRIKATGNASKGIKSDANVIISGGKIVCALSGNAIYDSSEADASSAAGIKCDGTFSMTNGFLASYSTGTGGKGINADGALAIHGGTINVYTTGTQYTYGSASASPKGIKCDGNMVINGGYIYVVTNGGENSEGIESKQNMNLNGGTIVVYSYDDCINAKQSITINGGYIYAYASNNDGIDSNGTLTINGGVIVASGTNTPEEGIDCDNNTFIITGGTILGIGGATSTPTANSCTQNSVIYTGSGSKGDIMCIANSSGTPVMVYIIPRDYTAMTLLFSSGDLTKGSYTIHNNGTIADGENFYGLYLNGNYSSTNQITSFTCSSTVTTIGSTTGGIGGGTQPGGGTNPGGGSGNPPTPM